jgi:hypothetical protein
MALQYKENTSREIEETGDSFEQPRAHFSKKRDSLASEMKTRVKRRVSSAIASTTYDGTSGKGRHQLLLSTYSTPLSVREA